MDLIDVNVTEHRHLPFLSGPQPTTHLLWTRMERPSAQQPLRVIDVEDSCRQMLLT